MQIKTNGGQTNGFLCDACFNATWTACFEDRFFSVQGEKRYILIYLNKPSWYLPCSRGYLVRMAKITKETSVNPRFFR